MAPGLGNVDDLASVKTCVMDNTRRNTAYLANFLGYGWCGGCSSPYVGEGFIRQGDTWEADKKGPYCEGYKSDYRLSMAYGDWDFAVKDMKFGEPIIEEMKPETADSGVVHNKHNTEVSETITRSETVTRSVSHTKTSSWKVGSELGITLGYSVFGASYKFSYENSETTTDSTGKVDAKTFQISTTKTLEPYSAARWELMVFKTRKTIPYTATVIVKFSTELRGFLRWGGGYDGDSTNYHYKYRGSGERPTFNYRFGDSQIPFYTALKQQSETNSNPWMWNDMKQRYSSAQVIIDVLCDEEYYEFELKGQFQDVEGKRVELTWDEVVSHHKNS